MFKFAMELHPRRFRILFAA